MNLQKINYQKELEKVLDTLRKEGKVPTLLLHSCCAPCSSYVLEYLSEYFKITVFYYNPNIYPESEYTNGYSINKNGEKEPYSRFIDNTNIQYIMNFDEFTESEQKVLNKLIN